MLLNLLFQSGISLSICLHGNCNPRGRTWTISFQSGISLSICLHKRRSR